MGMVGMEVGQMVHVMHAGGRVVDNGTELHRVARGVQLYVCCCLTTSSASATAALVAFD